MRRRDVLAFAGIVAGAAGVVALGFLLKKFIANKKVERFEEELVEKIVEGSPFRDAVKAGTRRKSRIEKKHGKQKATVKLMSSSSLKVEKEKRAKVLLSSMQKGREYSQIMLEQQTKLPYRSVRRYVEYLVQQGKVQAMGYGKGKRFTRAS